MLGRVIDRDFVANRNIYNSLRTVGGVHFSVGCAIIIAASFVPKGAFSFNPKVLNSMPLEGQAGDDLHADPEKLEKEVIGDASFDDDEAQKKHSRE